MKLDINSTKPATAEDVMKMESYKHLNKEQAQEVVDFCREWARILWDIMSNEEKREKMLKYVAEERPNDPK